MQIQEAGFMNHEERNFLARILILESIFMNLHRASRDVSVTACLLKNEPTSFSKLLD